MNRTLGGAALRVAACALFLPLIIPFAVITLLTMITAAGRWLACGPDDAATDRILLNPALRWADDLPLRLFDAAARIQRRGRGFPL